MGRLPSGRAARYLSAQQIDAGIHIALTASATAAADVAGVAVRAAALAAAEEALRAAQEAIE